MEQVYCLRADLLPRPADEVQELDESLYARVIQGGEFRNRDEAEDDVAWRQIIPYAVVCRGDQVFMVERLAGGKEPRLHSRLSIGIGGHINPVSHANARDVVEGALIRELHEELSIGGVACRAAGLIHTDRTPVDRVHTGVLYRVATHGDVAVRETDKLRGEFVPWARVAEEFDRLEHWSKLAAVGLAGVGSIDRC